MREAWDGPRRGAGVETLKKKSHLLVEGVEEQRKYCLPIETVDTTGAAPEKGRPGLKWLPLLALHSAAFTPGHVVEENTHPTWCTTPRAPATHTHKDKTAIQDFPGFQRRKITKIR